MSSMFRFFVQKLGTFSVEVASRRPTVQLASHLLTVGALCGGLTWLSYQEDMNIYARLSSPLFGLSSKARCAFEDVSFGGHLLVPGCVFRRTYDARASVAPISSEIACGAASCGANSLPPSSSTSSSDEDSPKPFCCLGRDEIANAAAAVGSAVVNLSVTEVNGFFAAQSIGSGTIIDPDGTILTCAHVVADSRGGRVVAKGKVKVSLQDGRTFTGALVNVDPHSDIAFLKINSKTTLPVAKLGSSSKLRPGDWVVAVGCPFFLQNTVTAGIVSCVNRKHSDLGLGGLRREYIQTDCAINMGNSGGPLVNLDGEVVGVNVMKIQDADGLNFAVPIDSVAKIVQQLRKNGRVVRPWLGLKLLDLDEVIIAELKDRDPAFPDVTEGILVPMLTPGSPAERAGFQPGDVVIQFAGRPVKSLKQIVEIIEDNVGVPMKVLVRRGSRELLLTIVPEETNFDM